MDRGELETAVLDSLVEHMAPKLKVLIHDLLRKGASVEGVRECLVWHTRRVAGRKHTFTELSVEEYLDRIKAGSINPLEQPK